MSRRWLVVCLLAVCLGAEERKKPVTLDAISGMMAGGRFGGGFGQVTWSPDGGRFAYQTGGSLWIYDAATQSKKAAGSLDALQGAAVKGAPETAYPFENRRVTDERIQWFPDGRDLLLLNGGDVFVWHVETGKWDQLTATPEMERDPKLSPDGKSVSFRRGNDLFVLDIATRKAKQLTFDSAATLWNARLDWVYPEELDLGTAHWWSPDSQSIAYLQFDVSRSWIFPHADLIPVKPTYEPQRYPKAGTPNADVRLGVVPAAGGETRWMGLGETRDALLARVNWLPDGKGIAVQRLNRVQDRLDLMVADPKTGQARTLLTETDPTWVNVSDDLRFLAGGQRFLWSSERSGFRHLYLYSLAGKLERQLTSGDWEVTRVAGVGEKDKQVYYVSTEKSPLERHLYKVGLNGKGRQALTTAPGTHTISMGPSAAFYIDAHSNLRQPARRTLQQTGVKELAVLEESNRKQMDEFEILPTEIVTVKAPDGETLYARLIRPAGFTAGKRYPAIVMVYGGPHAQSVTDAWPMLGLDQVLAHKGFAIWQVDNRGSAGRGHKWEAKLYRRLGRVELEDQKTGVAHLVSMGFVDPARVGMYGSSYGGFMTLYSLLNAPEVFSAGVAGAPVTDWRNYDTIYTERYLGLPQENAAGYKDSSPVTHAANLKGKLLLVHNFEDDNVLFQNSVQMMDALQKSGKWFEAMFYPQKTHGTMGPARRHMQQGIVEFFEKSLNR